MLLAAAGIRRPRLGHLMVRTARPPPESGLEWPPPQPVSAKTAAHTAARIDNRVIGISLFDHDARVASLNGDRHGRLLRVVIPACGNHVVRAWRCWRGVRTCGRDA